MSEELTKLITKRQTIRLSVSQLITAIKKEIAKPTPDIETLEDKVLQLPAKQDQLSILNEKIEDLIELSAYEKEVTDTQEFTDQTILCHNQASRIIFKSRQPTPPSVTTGSTSGSNNAPVRLPKLEIKKFSGTITEWQDFWTNFNVAIHKNAHLSTTDKYNYLKSYVEGAAERAISGLALTEENYDVAVKILSDRFGHKDLIINAHMNKLLNLPSVKNTNDVQGLRSFFEIVEVQIRSLQSLGLESEKYGSLLCPVILQRLPEEVTKAYTLETSSSTEWKLDALLSFLEKKVSAYERAHAIMRPYEKSEKQSDTKFNQRTQKSSGPPSAAALNVNVSYPPKPCVFCTEITHGPRACPNYTVKERRDIVNQKRLCFICLRSNHQSRSCRARNKQCSVCKKKKHHPSLCDTLLDDKLVNNSNEEETITKGAVLSSLSRDRRGTVLLQTAQGIASSPNALQRTTTPVRCLLDSGSHLSFVTEEISERLQLPVIGETTLELHVFGNIAPVSAIRKKVLIELRNYAEPTKRIIIEAIETPKICGAVFSNPNANITREMKSRGLQIADPPGSLTRINQDSSLDVLIGSNYFWEIANGKNVRLDRALVAMDTIFGWVLQGPSFNSSTQSEIGINTVAVLKVMCEEEQVSTQLRSFWELESLGITDHSSNSVEHCQALQRFEENVNFRDGRYEVSLPWKNNRDQLENNYNVAAKRTMNLLKKLRQDPILFQQYHDVIKDQLNDGVIEKVDSSKAENEVVFYLPHRCVIRESSQTTRLRIVYDASAHAAGAPSLNDCLEAGPNLNPDLLDILLRFRENKIAFTSDIEKAFLQIAISESDRDAVRFLWVEGVTADKNQIIKTYRATRVTFGVTSSPFLLMATIRHHLKKYERDYPTTCQLLSKSLFVDDLVSGAAEIKEAHQLASDSSVILSEAGMNLRKWKTNSPELRKLLKKPNSVSHLESASPAPDKVLGLIWDTEEDDLRFDMSSLLQFIIGKQNTKRWVLKAVSRIYDPLGLVSPFVIRAKLIFQALWEKGLSWDDPLPDTIAKQFHDWCAELTDLKNISIPRHYQKQTKGNSKPWQLHCFVDASEKAYATVIYMKYASSDEDFSTTLIAAKTRLAPLKKLTLPRLELMAAILGARLTNTILKAFSLPPSNTRLWTDSKIALQWIRGSASEWKPFISNRVREIQALTDPQHWGHCDGKTNPADIPTRGRSVTTLLSESLWWNGPAWLTNKEAPESKSTTQSEEALSKEAQDELRSCFRNQPQASLQVIEPADTRLLDINRFSSLLKLLRITAWIHRYCHNSRNPNDKSTGELAALEISKAESFWVRHEQLDSFPTEMEHLLEKKGLSKSSKLLTLNPFLDKEAIACVGGRLRNKEFSYEERHPRILPSSNHLTDLIARHHHNQVLHGGVNETLVDVRERYWIIRGRQVIKRIIHRCTICRRFRVKPSEAITAPLPPSRTTPALPFEVTGLDFAGPLYSKDNSKLYIALFTCAVTRAIHLELVSDMSTYNFMLAFRRFVSRRGMIKIIYSDNAKTYKRADLDLKRLLSTLKSAELAQHFGNLQISWRFITDRAPWQGGFYERLVRSVKNALRKILGQARLSYEELETTLIEAEAAINSRPLTYVYPDAGEPSPLTPAHFLVGKRLTALPSGIIEQKDNLASGKADLTKRWKYHQQLNEKFWNRWKTDYLLELRSAHHSIKKTPTRPLQVDDIVLIGEPKMPRLTWKTAVIEETFIGRDGQVRSCMVRLPNGTKMRRPLQLLYFLET